VKQLTPKGRLGLFLVGLLISLVVAEAALHVAGIPRFYVPHALVPQFRVTDLMDGDVPVYVNVPDTTIRFSYDRDPRGYFEPGNVVEHTTNRDGFRGSDFSISKAAGTLRIAFLGDSFTFGEGVRFEDTYPEVVARELRNKLGPGRTVESYNFGVGGYNTRQALNALRRWVLLCAPDVVVLGFVINDAEEPLVIIDPRTGRAARRERGLDILESMSDSRPPQKTIYRSRLAQLFWRFRSNRERTRRTIEYYKSLYDDENHGWQECKAALREIVLLCREKDIPLYVLDLPILIRLRDYPFLPQQEQIRQVVLSAGGRFVDLLPHMRQHGAPELWVHPTDQHPNEIAHGIAGKVLAKRMIEDGIR
jgi:lysophospholipase L1-like esterase